MYFTIYYTLIAVALILSVISIQRGGKRFLPLALLLFATLAVEVLAHVLGNMDIGFVWGYHLFCPLEYALFAWFIMTEIKTSWLRKAVIASIVLFFIFSVTVSAVFYNFKTMPGINIGVESIMLFMLCTYRLFNLEIADDRPIFLLSDFWVCTGLLIFYGVGSFFLGIYTPLFHLSQDEAARLYSTINHPINLLLYGLIIIGLLCSINRKYTLQ